MKGDSDGKQQKRVEQETAYSAVVVNVSPSLPISFSSCFYVKSDIGTGIHVIIHYKQFLVALVFADLPSLSHSFHRMIFIS